MLFNSWTFFVFFISVLALYYALPSHKKQNLLLLAASYVFYGAWNWRFLFLIFISTTVDYLVGLRLEKTSREGPRRTLLAISVTVNLGILGFFKYFNFFIDSAASMLSWVGLNPNWPLLEVVLPVGISFYTFQTMSYAVDVYRGQMKAVRSFPDYALYIAFFPQLVAGPIERASRMLPQFQRKRATSSSQVVSGLWLTLWGLFKKAVVADNLAVIVNGVFSDVSRADGAGTALAVYAFAFQIYCDFSGYSDIARGVAKLLGFELRLNFNLPYIAKNPKEFWSRWHISLSTWLRDYLYISLGGNRKGKLKTYRNLMITMLLGGLWHGAAWHFILWGAYHGVLLVAHRAIRARRSAETPPRERGPLFRALSVLLMFHLACVGWILFRVESIGDVPLILANLAGGWALTQEVLRHLFIFSFTVSVLVFIEIWLRNADDPRERPLWRAAAGPVAVGGLLVLLVVFASPGGQDFIYFQF
jgi:D-alanyl-lipoteichoic acid acyltransferase DltB (MBOAT superfamily)